MKSSPKREKKVKAWAVMWVMKPELDLERIYSSREEAEQRNRLDMFPYHKLVPLTITYSLPTATRPARKKGVVQ